MIIDLVDTAEAFIRLLYPENCVICKQHLNLRHRGLCRNCGVKISENAFSPLESLHPESGRWHDQVWSLYGYSHEITKCIHEIKFRHNTALIEVLLRYRKNVLDAIFGAAVYDKIIFIPMSPAKKIERYFNPAEEIAFYLSKRYNIELSSDFLTKKWFVPSQMFLNRKERLANLFGAFKMVGSKQKNTRRILLVDDIFTTGSTVDEAARTIKKQLNIHVDVLTLARTSRNMN